MLWDAQCETLSSFHPASQYVEIDLLCSRRAFLVATENFSVDPEGNLIM